MRTSPPFVSRERNFTATGTTRYCQECDATLEMLVRVSSYARADGSVGREVIRAMVTPNGVGLSPDGMRLYVAETIPGRVWWWEITAPGQVRIERTGTVNRGHLLLGVPGYQEFDSLAVDSAGSVCVATLHTGGITVISPDGKHVTHVPMPDPVTTNICFGGPGLRTAYITLSQTGRLVAMSWPRPGLTLRYAASMPARAGRGRETVYQKSE